MERCRGGDSIAGEGIRVIVGCAGWSAFRPKEFFGEDWKNRFSSVLNAYAKVFSFVEVNSTFYKLPKVSTAKRWREQVGEGFLFSIKAPREITHEKRFKGVEEVTERMLEVAKGMRAFFILFQTPKSFRFSKENLENVADYVSSLPSKFIYGLELRGWKNDEVERLLGRVNFVHVVDPFDRLPVTENLFYFRLHGSPPGERMYTYKYTDGDLRVLREKVGSLQGDVYIVFNNVWMCEDALRFKEIMTE